MDAVPLRYGGITRSITFVKDDCGRLFGHYPTVCGFVAAQGGCAHSEQEVALVGGQVTLRNDNGEPFDTLYLWLVTAALESAGIIRQNLQCDVSVVDLAAGAGTRRTAGYLVNGRTRGADTCVDGPRRRP